MLKKSKLKIQIGLGHVDQHLYSVEIHDGKIAGVYFKQGNDEKNMIDSFENLHDVIKSPHDFDFTLEHW